MAENRSPFKDQLFDVTTDDKGNIVFNKGGGFEDNKTPLDAWNMNTILKAIIENKENINNALNGLKGTKESGDTTPETIAGAKEYAKNAVNALINAYIRDDGDPSIINTLEKISNWIIDDETGAAKIISDVSNLENGKADITYVNESFEDKFNYIEIDGGGAQNADPNGNW